MRLRDLEGGRSKSRDGAIGGFLTREARWWSRYSLSALYNLGETPSVAAEELLTVTLAGSALTHLEQALSPRATATKYSGRLSVTPLRGHREASRKAHHMLAIWVSDKRRPLTRIYGDCLRQ